MLDATNDDMLNQEVHEVLNKWTSDQMRAHIISSMDKDEKIKFIENNQ